MPTSETGTSATKPARSGRGRAAGFTLIEILVVVGIIAVLTSVILLSVNLTGRDQDLEKESNRLTALLSYAREQAALQTRDYGVLFQDDGYEFLSFDVHKGVWRDVEEDDALAVRKLPDGLSFTLTLEGRPAVLKRPADDKAKTPQVMIFSNGDLTTFAATLQRDAGVRAVTVTEDDKGEVIQKPMVEAKDTRGRR
jgi:general secretion pathway protein H